jgi:hypothetical protein
MARHKHRCRDCERCTESALYGCLIMPIRIFADLIRRVLIFPFYKMCPDCGHPLIWHNRDESGRFRD